MKQAPHNRAIKPSESRTRDLANVKPTTLERIKRLAQQIRVRDGVQHCHALEQAAKQAGYATYAAARAALKDKP